MGGLVWAHSVAPLHLLTTFPISSWLVMLIGPQLSHQSTPAPIMPVKGDILAFTLDDSWTSALTLLVNILRAVLRCEQ